MATIRIALLPCLPKTILVEAINLFYMDKSQSSFRYSVEDMEFSFEIFLLFNSIS